MSMPKQVREAITRAIEREMKNGVATKNGIVSSAMGFIGKRNDYGLPRADLIMAARKLYSTEVDRQLKQGLPDNVIYGVAKNAPPELTQILSNLPQAIAISEGKNAQWVYSLTATPEQWRANFEMKFKIARRTQHKARFPKEVFAYLNLYGMGSLSEAMSMGQAA